MGKWGIGTMRDEHKHPFPPSLLRTREIVPSLVETFPRLFSFKQLKS